MKGRIVLIMKKRQFLTATLVLALGAAVFVNWYYSGQAAVTGDTETTTHIEQVSGNLGDSLYVAGTTAQAQNEMKDTTQVEYFAKAKLERSKSHDEVIDSLEDIIEKEGGEAVTFIGIAIVFPHPGEVSRSGLLLKSENMIRRLKKQGFS